MKKPQSTPHIRPTLLSAASRLCVLLALLAAGLLSSCVDDTFTSGSRPEPSPAGDTDMYISVSVPRTPGSGASTDKENRIETLDVLVFRNGAGSAAGSYFVHAACRGVLTENGKTFQVSMPVGEHFIIHVFANCHDELAAKGFYNSKGRERNTLLREFTTSLNTNTTSAPSRAGLPRAGSTLPMQGYISDITIQADDANRSLTIPVLRSVASVQVANKVVPDAGQKKFDLRELYVYFYPESGCVGAATTSYEDLGPGEPDETRNVKTVSLPPGHSVADTRQDAIEYPDHPRPYSLLSATPVSELGNLCFYENKPWSDTGFDQPDTDMPAATTRLVVGGVYDTDQHADGTPRVTYYRIDFTASGGTLREILRNHRYIFNIKTVGGPGYDTPDDAALGVPVNIYVEVTDWVNKVEHVDFDLQNYFRSETKSVVLPRNAGSTQSIAVESDVEAFKWQMAFASENNGPALLSNNGYTLANNRFEVTIAADGKSLTFKALKTYADIAGTETRDETLRLKVRNLNITYRMTQADTSPDDWGDGGDQNWEEGEKVIDLGSDFNFYFAPGNLRVTKDATTGAYQYSFAPQQQITSTDVKNGGYHFPAGKVDPFWDMASVGESGDPCNKMGAGWRLPSTSELRQCVSSGYVWGSMGGAGGFYYGRIKVPSNTDDPYSYLFLPKSSSRMNDGSAASNSKSTYLCSNGQSLLFINNGQNNSIAYWSSYGAHHVRCVKNKN